MKYSFKNESEKLDYPFHFFASSFSEWRVHSDVSELIRLMKKEKISFKIWQVRKPIDAHYPIRHGGPVVNDADYDYLGSYLYEEPLETNNACEAYD
jgi:hypothetical protein